MLTTRTLRGATLLGALGATAIPAIARADFLASSDFESPVVSPGSYKVVPGGQTVDDWTVSGTNVAVSAAASRKPASCPEPAMAALLTLALAGTAATRRRHAP